MPKDGIRRKSSSTNLVQLSLPEKRPVTPGSEYRKRKPLAVASPSSQNTEKLRLPFSGGDLDRSSNNNNNNNSSSIIMQSSTNNTTNNSNSERRPFMAMDIDVASAANQDSDYESRGPCRSRNGRRRFSTSSPRFRRSLMVMGCILCFCLLGLLREGEEEESILRQGNLMEEEQGERDVDFARKHHSHSHDSTLPSKSTSPLQPLGPKRPQSPALETTVSPKLAPDNSPKAASTPNLSSKATIDTPSAKQQTESTSPPIGNEVQPGDDGAINTPDADSNQPLRPEEKEDEQSAEKIKNSPVKAEPEDSEPTTGVVSLIEQPQPEQPIFLRPEQTYQTKAPYDPSMKLQQPILPLDTSNEHPFVQQYCDLQGSDWFPLSEDIADPSNSNSNSNNATNNKSWRQRAPFVMLVGPTYTGSDALWQLLASHPQIADAMNSQFFTYNYKNFVKSAPASNNVNSESKISTNSTIRIRTRAARQAYMARHISDKRHLEKNPSRIVLDWVPDTLLYSQKFAPFVMCVMPWVKLVITVSHPIRRLLRHYKVAQKRGLTLSLEDWVAGDLERMQLAGVLQDTSSGNSATKQAQKVVPDHDAWVRYQELTSTAMEASAGQSLYEYIAHPWFSVMEEMGRNPTSEIVVVQREMLVPTASKSITNPEKKLIQEYQRILKRLGLASHTPAAKLVAQITAEQQRDVDTWKDEIDEGLRKQLANFFNPYNIFFDQFLKSYYGKEEASSTGEGAEQLLNWDPDLWL